MKKSEQIRKQIEELEKEYLKAKDEESTVLIWKYGVSDKHQTVGIYGGNFNVKKAEFLLCYLANGKKLLLKHDFYGDIKVYMNSPQNNICAFDNKTGNILSNHDINIYALLLTGAGDWYLMID